MCLEFYFIEKPWTTFPVRQTHLDTNPLFFLWVSKALSKRALIHTFFLIPIFDWIRDTGNRKENNQFHESLHAQLCLCTPSISFIFHCQSRLSWQRHKGLISQYQTPVSKIQKVWWSDGNNCIHALKFRSGVFPHKHTQWIQSPFWFKFDFKLKRGSNTNVSRTCSFLSARPDGHEICLGACTAKQMTYHLLPQPFLYMMMQQLCTAFSSSVTCRRQGLNEPKWWYCWQECLFCSSGISTNPNWHRGR